MCESYNIQYNTNFVSVMPTNLYGINDNYDLEKSHVLPAMIRKFHLEKLLFEGNESGIKADLNRLPIKGISRHLLPVYDKPVIQVIVLIIMAPNSIMKN